MSFAIIRMRKFKAPDVKGMQIHNYREKESRTNPDIDEGRTQLNYDLLNDSRIDFKQVIQSEIDERYTGNKVIRKDAVMLCEFVVTSDKDFFDRLDPDQEKRFFEESLSFLRERYGKENILYGIIHKDEKTPHMHVGMIPITTDGRLAAKQFFGKRTELQQLQDKFHEHVMEKGFSLERGVSSDRKHITTQRLKAMTVKEEIKKLEQEKKEIDSRLNDLKESLDKVKSVDGIEVKERGGLMRPKTVEIALEDFESIKVLARASETLRDENKSLRSENDNLKIERELLKSENGDLKKDKEELQKENDFLKRMLEKVKDFYRQKVPELGITIGYIKAGILDKAKEKLLKRNFADENEIKGAQKFMAHKQERLEREKLEKLQNRKRDRGFELER
jgi:FtsZ-binding cell division protein ZapB